MPTPKLETNLPAVANARKVYWPKWGDKAALSPLFAHADAQASGQT